MFWITILIIYLFAFGLVFIVISENRNPLKTISWLLLLLLFPIGGFIVFYFVGVDTRKLRILSRKSYKRLKRKKFTHLIVSDTKNFRSEYKHIAQLLSNNNDSVLLQGNEITIFTNGKAKFESLIRDMENAKHHIHMQYYIFEYDQLGQRIIEVLKQKAQEGVEVRVLHDDVGSWKVKKTFYEEMKSVGVQITPYSKVIFPKFTSQFNYRNHRKIVIIDGIIGYLGGMNIADRYVSPKWRDTHIRVLGKGSLGMQSAFLIDWYSSGQSVTTNKSYFPDIKIFNNNFMQIATGDPVGQWRTLLQATLYIISTARQYIYIQTPYFLPTEGLINALQTASLGGIDVRLMIPAHSDVRFVHTAAHSFLDDMMKAGVKVYAYESAFLHSKTLISDDFITVVGSANMDFRSFEHNFEANAYIYDESFALRMKQIFMKDQEESKLVTLKEWRQRPKWKKMQESLMRMFSPLL